jgi:hypothetical protein
MGKNLVSSIQRTQPMKKQGLYRFVVKEGPDHTPGITAEPAGGDVVFELAGL